MPELSSPAASRLQRPGWLDGRLVLGVLLVLTSVVVGARVLASADDSSAVWVATHDLAAGSALAPGDLRAGRVRLFDSGERYLLAEGAEPVGYVLQRAVGADELLPRDSLAAPGVADRARRDVSVPVDPGHLPEDLRAGQLVDVFVTPGRASAATPPSDPAAAGPAGTRLVLSGVPVALRPKGSGATGASAAGVVLSVPEADVPVLVAALQAGGIDLVRVPQPAGLPALGPAGAAAPAR